jgi:hypothetical protein
VSVSVFPPVVGIQLEDVLEDDIEPGSAGSRLEGHVTFDGGWAAERKSLVSRLGGATASDFLKVSLLPPTVLP